MNEVFSKVQERIAILELYSQETLFSAETDDIDAASALFAFNSWNMAELREKLTFIIDRLVSFNSRQYVLAGLNFGEFKNDSQSMEQRLAVLVDRYGHTPAQARAFWKNGIALVCSQYDIGMKLYDANALIAKTATSGEAASAISWLINEYIQSHREK